MIALLIGIPLVILLVWLDRRDHRQCRKVNSRLVSLVVASRAGSLSECPPTFLAAVQAALDATEGDAP